jgi:hypothetical protein
MRRRRAALALIGTADTRHEEHSPHMSSGSGYQLASSCNNAHSGDPDHGKRLPIDQPI